MGSSAPPKRRLDFLADRATPLTLPSARVNSVTRASASRNGYVRKTIASDCFSDMDFYRPRRYMPELRIGGRVRVCQMVEAWPHTTANFDFTGWDCDVQSRRNLAILEFRYELKRGQNMSTGTTSGRAGHGLLLPSGLQPQCLARAQLSELCWKLMDSDFAASQ